jgi:hypothetical protein
VAYGGGLENRSPTLLGRGFESHPLRQSEKELAGLSSARTRQPILSTNFNFVHWKGLQKQELNTLLIMAKFAEALAISIERLIK